MHSNHHHAFSAERRFIKWLSSESLDTLIYYKTPDYRAAENHGSPDPGELNSLICNSVKHMSQYLRIDEKETVHALWSTYQDLAKNRFVLACRNLMNLKELPGSPSFFFESFDNYLHFCNNFVCQQKSAIEKGIPSLHIIALQKSASSFITSVLAQGLDIPACTTSLLHAMIVPSWLRCFLRGGAVTHEHTFPFRANIALLRTYSAQVIIHVRNLKQVIVSSAHFYKKYLKESVKSNLTDIQKWLLEAEFSEFIDFFIEIIGPYYGKWISGWLKAHKEKAIDMKFTSYEDFVNNGDLFFEKITGRFSLSSEATKRLKKTKQELTCQQGMYNIRNMQADEWREVLTRKQQQRVDELIPREFNIIHQKTLSRV